MIWVQHQKKRLRKTALLRRKRLRETSERGSDKGAYREMISLRLMRVFQTKLLPKLRRLFADDHLTVAGFLPIGTEIDPRPLFLPIRQAGWKLALPALIAPAMPLVFRRWQRGDALMAQEFGGMAPLPSAKACHPDILLVPMLAFDMAGNRLGYGGGYYDRSLKQLRRQHRVVAIGVAYARQKVLRVPTMWHDQKLDFILTEQGVIPIAPIRKPIRKKI